MEGIQYRRLYLSGNGGNTILELNNHISIKNTITTRLLYLNTNKKKFHKPLIY